MSKLAFVLPLAALLAALLAASTRAESLSCSSVNGATLCSRSGSTSCQSVNGKTICCETIGNRTECHDMPDATPPRRPQPQDQGQPDDDDAQTQPLLLPDRNVDINSTILSLLLLQSGIHAAVPTIVLPDPVFAQRREIVIAETIRRNQQMLLLAGKLPRRTCIVNCGALNSFDGWHRP